MRYVVLVIALCGLNPTILADDGKPKEPVSMVALVEALRSPEKKPRDAAVAELEQRLLPFSDLYADYGDGEDDDYLKRMTALRRELRPCLARIIEAIDSPHEDVATVALAMLSILGPEARSALPALQKRIDAPDADLKTVMQLTMAVIPLRPATEPVTPTLLKLADSFQWCVWRDEIKEYDPLHFDAGLVRGKRLRRSAPGALSCVAITAEYLGMLLTMHGRSTVEVPALLEAMKPDSPRQIRLHAVALLANLGEEAVAAVPRLRELLLDPDPIVRVWSGYAVLSIRNDPFLAWEIVAELDLSRDQERVFRKELGPVFAADRPEVRLTRDDLKGLIPIAERSLRKSRNPVVRRQTMRQLRDWGSAAVDALPALREALDDPDGFTRAVAAEAIRRIEAK